MWCGRGWPKTASAPRWPWTRSPAARRCASLRRPGLRVSAARVVLAHGSALLTDDLVLAAQGVAAGDTVRVFVNPPAMHLPRRPPPLNTSRRLRDVGEKNIFCSFFYFIWLHIFHKLKQQAPSGYNLEWFKFMFYVKWIFWFWSSLFVEIRCLDFHRSVVFLRYQSINVLFSQPKYDTHKYLIFKLWHKIV